MKKTTLAVIAVTVLLAGGLHAAGKCEVPPELRDAMELDRQGKHTEAVEKINGVMASRPESENEKARLSLGLIHYRAKEYDSALGEFSKTLSINRDNPMAHYFKAMIYEKKALGQADAAASSEMKRMALESWESYLAVSGRAGVESEAHVNIGAKKEDAVERARRHIETLKRELGR
ncbi:MAG: tetratricopeptide repeat protein [Endomicrobiales bacterium]|nr:tetratricopeptide repeat protein [Endomicrobiales bacterium]